MKTYSITERGQVFAAVEARTPQAALRKAHKQSRKAGSAYCAYPRAGLHTGERIPKILTTEI